MQMWMSFGFFWTYETALSASYHRTTWAANGNAALQFLKCRMLILLLPNSPKTVPFSVVLLPIYMLVHAWKKWEIKGSQRLWSSISIWTMGPWCFGLYRQIWQSIYSSFEMIAKYLIRLIYSSFMKPETEQSNIDIWAFYLETRHKIIPTLSKGRGKKKWVRVPSFTWCYSCIFKVIYIRKQLTWVNQRQGSYWESAFVWCVRNYLEWSISFFRVNMRIIKVLCLL